MAASWEHVHRLNGLNGEAASHQALYVPGQGGGIAGDVDHPGGAGLGNGLNHRGLQALAGRIHQHRVAAEPFPDQPGQHLFRGAGVEDGVGNAVALRVAAGVFHRVRHDFDPHGGGAAGRRGQGDGSGAAVDVADVFMGLQGRKVQGGTPRGFRASVRASSRGRRLPLAATVTMLCPSRFTRITRWRIRPRWLSSL